MKELLSPTIGRAVLLAATALCSSGAFAAAASNITITSFNATASAGTLSWISTENYRSLDAEASNQGGLTGYDASTWSGSTSGAQSGAAITTSATSAYSSQSGATTTLLGLSASALGTGASVNTQPNSSFAIGTQSGAFTLSQAGTVTFTIGYTASVSTFSSALESAYAMAAIDVGNYASGLDQASNVSFSSSLVPTGSGSFSGVLTVQVAMGGASDMGYYTLDGRADASAIAAVPEPETWAMLPAGLLVLGALNARRRRRGDSSTNQG